VKVIIQIPCLNEEKTLPLVFGQMPRELPGVDSLEFLIIDDGSTDRTVEIAEGLGVHHIVRHTRNMGLGRSFHDGVTKALELGADIVVNTDGDNQYPSARIADLIQPILDGQADIVVADRQTHLIEHFSPAKKLLQRVGSKVVNMAADTELPDAASGFRAYSREAIIRLNTVTRFSYCMETIIQAGNKHLAISSVPIDTNAKTRESRLFTRTSEHVAKSAATIIRSYLMYRPLPLFFSAAGVFFVAGLVPLVRYLYLVAFVPGEGGTRHIQSLVFTAVLMIVAFICVTLGVLADLIRINRILLENTLELQKRDRFERATETRSTAAVAASALNTRAAVNAARPPSPVDSERPQVRSASR
jgi:glycosyltransferase involved in cell wall biosynthesis